MWKIVVVADPLLVDNVGEVLSDGENSKFIFEEVIDEDLASQYPNEILALNTSPETFIGKADIIIERMVYEKKQWVREEVDITFDLIGDYVSGDYVNIGTKWLGYHDTNYFDNLIKERKAVA